MWFEYNLHTRILGYRITETISAITNIRAACLTHSGRSSPVLARELEV